MRVEHCGQRMTDKAPPPTPPQLQTPPLHPPHTEQHTRAMLHSIAMSARTYGRLHPTPVQVHPRDGFSHPCEPSTAVRPHQGRHIAVAQVPAKGHQTRHPSCQSLEEGGHGDGAIESGAGLQNGRHGLGEGAHACTWYNQGETMLMLRDATRCIEADGSLDMY